MELSKASDIALELSQWITVNSTVKKTNICGSIRRQKPEVKDIDLALLGSMPDFSKLPGFEILWSGEKKVGGVFKDIRVDIRTFNEMAEGSMMLHLTGSAYLNRIMRINAMKKKLKLNEYGLWNRTTEERIPAFSEKEIFQALDMQYLDPLSRSL